ncbi:hypothetical protein M9H77_22552 [Catharanthus roseus]|uniref:Uncharacterized protein n=1 Tax=Catharanthus roseus TaxID=4058 RepID=A0ACC0ARQ4_CATRO|nr:hypothetical protein M9H77_22552 [Catharanthus roseus]
MSCQSFRLYRTILFASKRVRVTFSVMPLRLSLREPLKRVVICIKHISDRKRKKNTKPRVDDEEEVPIKKRGALRDKKNVGYLFKLKGEQIATSENWQLFVHDGRHNHEIAVYNHGHVQAARLTEEQLKQTEHLRKSHVPPRNILRFLRELNVGCAFRKYTMFLPRLRRTGCRRNTVEEVLGLSVQRGYTVFYRNTEDNNVLSDIVVAHPTSIAMIRTWPYTLIMDTTYKTNNESILNDGDPIVIITDRESRLMPVIEDVLRKSYHMLRRRHINQTVLTKLTEMVKDE